MRFSIPRTCDGHDMAGWRIRVHYEGAAGTEDRYEVTDAEVSDDSIGFTWVPRPPAFEAAGNVTVAVDVALVGEDGATVIREFNSACGTFRVLKTVDSDPFGPRLVDDEGSYIVLGTEE